MMPATVPPARPVHSILVAGAWAPELAPLRRALGDAALVALREIGVGLVDAAAGAARAIDDVRPAAVVFVGTAGVYPGAADDLPIGAAVVVRAARLVSTAAVRGDAYLPAPVVTRVATDRDLRRRIASASGAGEVDAACPLAITSSAAAAQRVARATRCDVESLEVFAAARVAAGAALPFAAVLGISNVVGPRAHAEWRRHHAEAAHAACDAVLAWLIGAGAPDRGAQPGCRAPAAPS